MIFYLDYFYYNIYNVQRIRRRVKMILKQLLFFFVLILFLFSFMSCQKSIEPINWINFLRNSDIEEGLIGPAYWDDGQEGYAQFDLSWSEDESVSTSHSLKIQLDSDPNSVSFARWAQSRFSNIPAGKEIILRASIKCENVTGRGVAIAVRGDDSSSGNPEANFFISSEGDIRITGTKDWEEYSLPITILPPNIDYLAILLVFLADSRGTVYFDDITLSYKE
jgi:hypothetical protein